MNDIYSVTVDATLDHGMHAKKCETFCNKMHRNKQDLDIKIIWCNKVLKPSE